MKRMVAMAALLAASLGSFEAKALELGTRASTHPYRSAQHFALELRFSPYYAQVDEDPKIAAREPFSSTFGSGPRFMIGLEVDWQTLRIPHIGTIGPGLGLGRVSMNESVKTDSGKLSMDETSLTIYPFWAVAVLRVDVLWRDLGVPFVPYAKAGVGMALWRASNSGGTAVQNNVSGKGHSFGTSFAVGLALALDALDSGASRDMDNAIGINNTYLYAEAYWLGLNGLGQTNALRVGSNTWAAGLAFEF
jgi:opacity protein-like surface antigen